MGQTSTAAAAAQSTPESQLVLSHAIATVAKTVDEKILALPGSRDRLLPAIRHAIAYYERAINTIPGPIGVSAEAHPRKAALSAVFPTADDITAGLGRSIAVRNSINWFVENEHSRVFAIMGTRLRPGSSSAGLTDHTFRSLAASDHDSRECLCEAAFTGLINAFSSRLRERIREWRALHAGNQPQLGDGRSAVVAALPSAGPSQRQQEIFASHLDPNGNDLSAEDGLNALIEWLQAPEAQLRINTEAGQAAVMLDGNLTLPLLSSTDRRHWLVCLTEISLQEVLDAIGKTPAANRYILI